MNNSGIYFKIGLVEFSPDGREATFSGGHKFVPVHHFDAQSNSIGVSTRDEITFPFRGGTGIIKAGSMMALPVT